MKRAGYSPLFIRYPLIRSMTLAWRRLVNAENGFDLMERVYRTERRAHEER